MSMSRSHATEPKKAKSILDKLQRVSKETIPKSKKQQCWYCKHNEVCDLCADCLNKTILFEKTNGKQGEFKPAWEYGTVDERWVKGRD